MPRSWSLALLVSFLAPGSRDTHPRNSVLAFVGVAVIPMDREHVLENQTVLVRGKTIIAIGPISRTPVPAGAMEIDGRGKYLLPGLADMHTHLLGARMEAGVLSKGDEPTIDSVGIERMLRILAANGVTTIRNMDYVGPAADLLQWRAWVAAGEVWAPRIYTSGPWYIDPTLKVDENLAAYKTAGYDFIKPYLEEGPLLDSLVAGARNLGLPLAGHATAGLAYALEHRYKSIEHLYGFPNAYNAEVAGDTLEIATAIVATRKAGAWVCPTEIVIEDIYGGHTGITGYRRSLPAERRNSDRPGVMGRRFIIKALQDAGVGLLLGTDEPFDGTMPGVSVHHELQALVWAGLTPYQALLTGTRNVAAYLGTEDSTGTVAVGKRADLILLHGNPLLDIRNSSNLAGVMIAGRWRAQAEIEREMEGYAQADSSLRPWFKWP